MTGVLKGPSGESVKLKLHNRCHEQGISISNFTMRSVSTNCATGFGKYDMDLRQVRRRLMRICDSWEGERVQLIRRVLLGKGISVTVNVPRPGPQWTGNRPLGMSVIGFQNGVSFSSSDEIEADSDPLPGFVSHYPDMQQPRFTTKELALRIIPLQRARFAARRSKDS